MTEQHETKKKAGSIRQYATLGRKTSERFDITASRSLNAETSERPEVEVLEHQNAENTEVQGTLKSGYRDVETPERPDVEALKTQEVQELMYRDIETSRGQNAETSERPGVQVLERRDARESKLKRERHTIYFPPELSEWVKIRAVITRREISEIVTEAVERYKSETE